MKCAGKVALVNLEQALNTSVPNDVTESGTTADVIAVPLNAKFPIVVSPFGKAISAREEQPANAPFPYVFMELGTLIDASFEQPSNALFPMEVNSFPFIVTIGNLY